MHKLAALMMAGTLSGCLLLPKLHVGVAGSAVIPEDDEALEATIQGDVCLRVTAAMLQVEGSLGVKTYEYSEDVNGNGVIEEIEKGELDQMPVSLVVKYALGTGRLALAIGGGLMWNVNDSDEIENLTVDDSLGYKVVVGLNLGLVLDLLLSVEAQYEFNEAEVESAIPGDEVDTSGLLVRVGILYNF